MPFADDLLEQAHHLVTREEGEPKQASLRRAVSTAYYALFHLLIDEAVSQWAATTQHPGADVRSRQDEGNLRRRFAER
jgi:hypothetical protein